MRPHAVLSAALGDRRRRLVASARGEVADVGGYSDNGPHYPAGVSVHDLAADEVASLAGVTFDTVVVTFTLCRAADPGRLLAAVRGLLRPDGRLLFLEHVRGGGLRGTMQRVASPVWQRAFDGCRPDRDPVESIRAAGFFVTDLDRFSIRLAAPVVRPAVHGVARIAA